MRALRSALLLLVALLAGIVLWLDLTDLSRSEGRAAITVPAAEQADERPAASSQRPPDGTPPGTSDPKHSETQQAARPTTAPETAPAGEPAPGTTGDPALLEDGPYGPLPRIGVDGRRPSKVYAARSIEGLDKPRVAVVITGLGLAAAPTEAAIAQLPAAVTLAFSPYAEDLPTLTQQARSRGHELLVAVPMEPIGYPANDPGNRALLTAFPAAENVTQLKWALSRFTGYVGVIPSFGSRFLASPGHLAPILQELNNRGLLFVDHGASGESAAPSIVREIKLPTAFVERQIDEQPAAEIIDAELAAIEEAARRDGSAVAIGNPYPVTIDRVAIWLAGLPARGLMAVPVSTLAK